ncbi:hypothetical protein [Rhizobium leguminosarum]|uniref:hypothetical protein n=1 Tax=Rhizobium leguminosarum TaxID=384 RepID=UPI0010312497|nr:hypothetical protein [Rhizobium leguminosarum]TAU74515.1 hypothetical protein ELI40_27740 [Rhizobium leguminosarum]TAX04296.1 hypothetical protein ELI07_27625 [Rhizobium leguminosarum]TAY05985.1 hypothetical protein ELH96_29405 [Rhizobium leguminosarum]TAZ04169.1 hypothetical protein ELH81_29845 [Rhizobium leguminosarum]
MTAAISHLPWSQESLFAKARLYVGKMESHTANDWQYGLWSALALELIARAALAHFSPVLLADASNWRNLTYALGHEPTAKKFNANSIGSSEVISRLNELYPEFTAELAGFCTQHIKRRNSELHTGELIFSELGTSQWLPSFYLAIQVLLKLMGLELKHFVSDAPGAQKMIDAFEDRTAKAVEQDIKAHQKVWTNKSNEEREAAVEQAKVWATRQSGHRVNCPACQSPALLQGNSSGVVATQVDEGEIVQKQTMLPTSFECIACGLRIAGLSKLAACGLGDAFTSTSVYTAAEYFDLFTEDDLEEAKRNASSMYEEDFNE